MPKEAKSAAELAAMIQAELQSPGTTVFIYQDEDDPGGWIATAYMRSNFDPAIAMRAREIAARLRAQYDLKQS